MELVAHDALGRLAYEENDLPLALSHFRSAVDPVRAGIIVLAESSLAYAMAAIQTGQSEVARSTIDQLLSSFFDRNVDWEPVAVRAFEARAAWSTGNRQRAQQWARAAQRPPVTPEDFMNLEVPQVIQAMILIDDDLPDHREKGRPALGELQPYAERLQDRQRAIQLRILRAIDLDREGNTSEAMDILASAIGLANDHVRTFLDLGTPFVRLFRRFVTLRGAGGHATVLVDALERQRMAHSTNGSMPPGGPEAFDRNGPLLSSVDVPGLSNREAEILGMLERRLSNKELADHLSISPPWVKRHTSNIYLKLGVSSRRQAVHAARAFQATA